MIEPQRRDFLKILGIGGGVMLSAPLLAACGGGSEAGTPAAVANAEPLTDEQLKKILDYIGPIDPKYSGKGVTWNLGLFLAYSGTGQFFGRLMGAGAKLAADHIKRLGGPDIKFREVDHASGDPQKATAGLKEIAGAGIGGVVSSYGAGSVPQQLANLELLALDPGGGVLKPIFEGLPYFYGTRGSYPTDNWGGFVDYVTTEWPDKTRVVTLDYDYGGLSDAWVENLEKVLADAGLELVGKVTTAATTTDFSAALTQVKAANPDVIITTVESTLIGYLAKNYLASGITAPLFCHQWTSAAQEIAGDAFSSLYFLGEYIDPDNPPNEWAQLFVQDYTAREKRLAETYPCEFYETTFAFWQLARDVLKAGGDINSGPDLLAALEANPVFPSLFGGSGPTPGSLELDLATHSVAHRALSLTKGDGDRQDLLATFDITGEGGFELA